MSENTLSYLMGRMGYKGIATPHGFRSLATDVLNENGFDSDVIERQLAHVEQNKVRAAYHRTEYIPQRKELMQWYSDFLRERYRQAEKELAGILPRRREQGGNRPRCRAVFFGFLKIPIIGIPYP